MTNEEAIKQLKECILGMNYMDDEAVLMAIKALEQKAILDKITAEIENHCGLIKEDYCKYCGYCNSVMGVREILEIINKYKAESEDKR